MLWALFALNVAFGSWLLAVPNLGSAGIVGTIITLGGNATVCFVLASIGAGALFVAVPLTRGLTRSGGLPLVLIAIGGLCGVTAVAGVVAVVVAVALGLLFVVIDRL